MFQNAKSELSFNTSQSFSHIGSTEINLAFGNTETALSDAFVLSGNKIQQIDIAHTHA
jgi:hypothetical protein